MRKLEEISMNADLRKYVKTLCIEDDREREDIQLSLLGPQMYSPTNTSHIWPRDDAQLVKSSGIGIARLKAMFMEGRLHPETIKIRDYRGGITEISIEPTAALLKDILDGANLAVVSIQIKKKIEPLVEATVRLSPERQGQNVAFSTLQSTEFCLGSSATSYWSNQFFYHAPVLVNLKLSFDKPWNPQVDSMLSTGAPVFKLKQFELSTSILPAHTVLTILAKSKQSLTDLSFSVMKLSRGSNWRELLSTIGSEFSALRSFNLKFLSEDESGAIKFEGIGKERIDRDYGPGIEIFERGPQDNKRITWVRYKGSCAGSVLQFIASRGRPP